MSTTSTVGPTSVISRVDFLTRATYSLKSAVTTVTEGSTATFTLTTTNVKEGTSIGYYLSGLSYDDITNGSSSGVVIVGANGKATISVPIKADATNEGNETLTVSVKGAQASVVILDNNTVNEGSTAKFILNIPNVAKGTVVPYTISGVSATDIVGSLTGKVSVGADGKATIPVQLKADKVAEGNETLTVTAGGVSAKMTVNDTSVQTIPLYSSYERIDNIAATSNTNSICIFKGNDPLIFQDLLLWNKATALVDGLIRDPKTGRAFIVDTVTPPSDGGIDMLVLTVHSKDHNPLPYIDNFTLSPIVSKAVTVGVISQDQLDLLNHVPPL